MADASFEIVLVDNAAPSPASAPAPPGAGSTVPSPSAIPASTATGSGGQRTPRAKAADDEEDGDDGLDKIGKRFGFGKIVSATQSMMDAIAKMTTGGAGGLFPVSAVPVGAPPVIGGAAATAGGAAATGTATAAGGAAAGLAGGAAAAGAGGVVATALATLGGPVGIAIMAVIDLGEAVGKASKMIVDGALKLVAALQEDVAKLAEFSAELSISQAQADLRQQRAEIDRAQRNGPELAQFNDVSSRIQTEAYKALTSIEQVLVEIFTPILEEMLPYIRLGADVLKIIADQLGVAISAATGNMKQGARLVKQEIEDGKQFLKDLLAPDDDPTGPDPFTNMVLGMPIDAAGAQGAQPDANDEAIGMKLLRIFGGRGGKFIADAAGGI